MPQSTLSLVTGEFSATNYNFPPTRLLTGNAVGAATVTPATGQQCLLDGTTFAPFATNAPLLFDIGSAAETVTPSAVSGANTYSPGSCLLTATFGNAHGQGCLVQSGTAGLQEAINAANTSGGGVVNIDQTWVGLGGTSAMITAAVNGTKVSIVDVRGAFPSTFVWNGTGFQQAVQVLNTPVALSASGAIVPGVSGYYVVTKAGVAALTIAAPVAGDAGKIITITSRTANAHTLTGTGILNTGSANVNVATFAAFAGAGLTLIADNLKWNVLYSTGITFS